LPKLERPDSYHAIFLVRTSVYALAYPDLGRLLVECRQEHPGRDANTNRFLRTCDVIEEIPEILARRAAFLRTRARRGSAVDAPVVALAEPGGLVLTSDPADLIALAARAADVRIERV
jgi:hypothetical protein